MHLVQYVTVGDGARTSYRDVATRLSRIGWIAQKLQARSGGIVKSGRYWVSPPGWVDGEIIPRTKKFQE